jgi:hypothetical protein
VNQKTILTDFSQNLANPLDILGLRNRETSMSQSGSSPLVDLWERWCGDGMICSVISRRGVVVMGRYVLHPRCGVSGVMSTFLSRRFVVILIRCELVASYFSYWTFLLLPEHFLFILVNSSMVVALLIKHGESMFLEEHITVDIKIIYNNH